MIEIYESDTPKELQSIINERIKNLSFEQYELQFQSSATESILVYSVMILFKDVR